MYLTWHLLRSSSVSSCSGIDGEYIDYDDQSTWPELCLTGQLQSPIDLPDDVYSVKEATSINTPSRPSHPALHNPISLNYTWRGSTIIPRPWPLLNTPPPVGAASDTSVKVANDDDHAIKVAYYPGEANNTFTVPILDQDTKVTGDTR